MVRYCFLIFFSVSFVAVIGLFLFFDFQATGSVVTAPDCSRFAFKYDVLFQGNFARAQGKAGYFSVLESRLNPCTGQMEEGVYELFVQMKPLKDYGRFVWGSGAVYGHQGGEIPEYGNILYWRCPDGFRARVVLSDTEVCNSFGSSFSFDDGALPRH